LVLLAGLAVRVLASAPDDPPRPRTTATSSASADSGTTGEVRVGAPPDVFPVDPSDVHLFPVGCNQTDRTCLLDTGVPAPFLRAVRDRFRRIATQRASMTRAARPVGTRLIILYFFGRDEAGASVSISVRPDRATRRDHAGVRRSGRQLDVHADTYRGGYRVQVDVVAPPALVPPVRKVAGLAGDPRLRP
jgi:hypothetical protein